jgi:hypothetical protein
MPQLGDFDRHRAAAFSGEFPAAFEAGSRPLESFHGAHRAVLVHHGLANFQPRNFLRDVKAKFLGRRWAVDGGGPSRNPAPGMSGCNHGVASINSTPSFRSSAETAPKMVCAFFSLSRSNTLNPRRSGRTSYRFLGASDDHDALFVAPAW